MTNTTAEAAEPGRTDRPNPLHALRMIVAQESQATAAVEAYEALLCMHARLRRIRTNALAEFGLRDAQLRVVKIVEVEPGISISQIARRLDLSRQAVHRVVHRLARDNYLELRRGRRRGRPMEVSLSHTSGRDARAAREWELDWMGRDLASITRADWMPAVCWLSRRLRAELPWRIDDVEELDVYSLRRKVFPSVAFAPEYAVREAASRTPRSGHPSAGMPRSGSSGTQ